jgi:hypothetical protein
MLLHSKDPSIPTPQSKQKRIDASDLKRILPVFKVVDEEDFHLYLLGDSAADAP